MGWQTTYTKQGLEALAALKGKKISIVSAKVGSGIVPEEELQEQTNLVEWKQTISVIEESAIKNKKKLRLQVTNKEVLSSYMLNQIGIFIQIEKEEPLLYYIAQNEKGDTIPSKEEITGFISEYVATLVFANSATITVEGGGDGVITPNALDGRLEHFYNKIKAEIGTITSKEYPKKEFRYWNKIIEPSELSFGNTSNAANILIGNASVDQIEEGAKFVFLREKQDP